MSSGAGATRAIDPEMRLFLEGMMTEAGFGSLAASVKEELMYKLVGQIDELVIGIDDESIPEALMGFRERWLEQVKNR